MSGLALFDLDNTLLSCDSDYLWGQFLAEKKLVSPDHEERNRAFFQNYRTGRLDMASYLAFALAPMAAHPRALLESLRQDFLDNHISPHILTAGRQLMEQHRAKGDSLLIITATNRFVAEPIAEALGCPTLLATELETKDGEYTGRPLGEPCFREGKLHHLENWRKQEGLEQEPTAAYSDSYNDLPLLGRARCPVAVDPDPELRHHAVEAGWAVISLRKGDAPAVEEPGPLPPAITAER